MMRFLALALFAGATATPALSETATMSAPIQAASLHEGRLDMVAYWLPKDEGHEVTATFRGREDEDQPMRIVMLLADGDEVAFSMPGHLEALYAFSRRGAEVEVSVTVTGETIATN